MSCQHRPRAAIALLASVPAGAAPRSKAADGSDRGGGEGRHRRRDQVLRSRALEHAARRRSRRARASSTTRIFQDRRDNLDRYLEARWPRSTCRSCAPPSSRRCSSTPTTRSRWRRSSIIPASTTIRDIGGVWDEAGHRVGGFDLTLDDIEHTLLRPYFRDPRIHFAVNCASASCAPLPRWAFAARRSIASSTSERGSFSPIRAT